MWVIIMKKNKLDIIYQDKHILVINKPCGLLTVSTDKEKEHTLFHQVYTYEKQKNKNNKIFIVHRLDKDTSGLIIFAKSEKVKYELQNNWDSLVKERKYIALVCGNVKKDKDTIKSYIKENKNFISYSSNKKGDGKLAITYYEKIKSNAKYSLLNIKIYTGRKNQIRVHMNDIGHPIVGDKKYNSPLNPIKRMGLHATELEVIHPITKETLTFKSPIPKSFNSVFIDNN